MTSRQLEQQIKKLSAAFRKDQRDFILVLPYPSTEWEYSQDVDTCIMKQNGIIDIEIRLDQDKINVVYYWSDKDNIFSSRDYISITRPFKYYDKVQAMWQELCNA